jgi:endonuclease/exonuclease/phosphatase family metal-dependent hydrolase
MRATLRVMTWNIHGAAGRNPRFDLTRVIALIKRWEPDVVALQEIDSRRKVDGDGDPFALLQTALGSHGIGAKSITTADGDYGQMVISRWPMTSEIHDISFREREPRRAIRADVATPVGPLRMVATHLGLSIRERKSQTRTLLALAGRERTTTLLVGDFNDWFWPGSVRSALSHEFAGYTRYRTFPSGWPLLRLDRIYCRPMHALVRSFVDHGASEISDHLPIIAEVELGNEDTVEGRAGIIRSVFEARPATASDR